MDSHDAIAVFASIFGGERFKDYVCCICLLSFLISSLSNCQIGEITLMKDMTSAMDTMTREENSTESGKGPIPVTESSTGASHSAPTDSEATVRDGTPGTMLTVSVDDTGSKRTSMHGPPTHPKDDLKDPDKMLSKKELRELEMRRKKEIEERVAILELQLVQRLRLFVDAEHPGAPDDPETKKFRENMQREADDLKLESFGLEVSHGMGYFTLTHAGRSSFMLSA